MAKSFENGEFLFDVGFQGRSNQYESSRGEVVVNCGDARRSKVIHFNEYVPTKVEYVYIK